MTPNAIKRALMHTRTLGRDGPKASALGLGCMGLSAFYGHRMDDAAAIALIHKALEWGVNLLDSADIYGPHTNEELLAQALKGRRDDAFIATKFGIVLDPADPTARGVNGYPDDVKTTCEASLQRLKVDRMLATTTTLASDSITGQVTGRQKKNL